jgi:DNA-binding NtrC family response regulator
VRTFLAELLARRDGRALEPTRDALRALSSYAWPGNVRELKAEVMRWAVFCDERVDLADLAPEVLGRSRATGASREASTARPRPTTLAEAVKTAEREVIAIGLLANGKNLSRTARELGIDRNTLKRKLARYGLRGEAECGF